MQHKDVHKTIITIVSATLITLMSSQSAFAAPGVLPTAPLFLSSGVESNILFTLDDSSTMKEGFLVDPDLAVDVYNVYINAGSASIGNGWRYYYNPMWYEASRKSVLPPHTLEWAKNAGIWMFRNHLANKNYYNPDITYEPWAGVKADGTPMFTDANARSVPYDPATPATNEKPDTDLTKSISFEDHRAEWSYDAGTNMWTQIESVTTVDSWLPTYHIWNDSDGDGVIEWDDDYTTTLIKNNTPEMQNFANWFVYYRTRAHVLKAAIGRLVNNAEATRMGFDTLNNPDYLNPYSIADMESMTDASAKRNLLDSIYSMRIDGGTGSRISLKRAGMFFARQDNSAPILSLGKGGECQQNFNILVTDGFWDGYDSPGVGNADGDNNSMFDGGSYADSYSNTLADIAMYNYETDLRPDLPNKVPTTTGIDDANHQHLVTYTITFGLKGGLTPDTHDPKAEGFEWPQVIGNRVSTLTDTWHAAYNGRGEYLQAQSPEELEKALEKSITNLAQRQGTATAVSVNSGKLTTDSVVYTTEFNTEQWQGKLSAYKIAATGDLAASPEWNAASVLDDRNLSTNPRVILTHNSNETVKGVAFQWSNLSDAQTDDLKTDAFGKLEKRANSGVKYPAGRARLDYLRGDRSNEGVGYEFRERGSLLGDLVNSGPVYVGAPILNWPDTAPFPTDAGSRYSDFKAGVAKNRTGTIYVASNDAMLHGFSEVDGSEVLAYIPENIFSDSVASGLHYLTEPNYLHKYYNDLTPTVSDVFINSRSRGNLSRGAQWRSILIGGQRGGGAGIYALDVTDPTKFTEDNAADLVLWEFTSDDDADLGYTYSKPQIAKSNDSSNSWVAIFGNGYNNNGSGKAALFILTIDKGIDGTWEATDYKKITVETPTSNLDKVNGLSTPALADLDGNGTVDRVYAGDLKGQMWAFDLSGDTQASWALADPSPLFTTEGGQPLTAKPALSKHPGIATVSANEPNLMVFFGSGQYLTKKDNSSTTDNHFYGVWDKGTSGLDSDNLVEQTFETDYSKRVLSSNPVDYNSDHYGWFFKLPDSGERSVTRPVVRGETLFFNSFVPIESACATGGYGYRFAIDLPTGGAPGQSVFDIDDDDKIDENDKVTGDNCSGNCTQGTGVVSAIKEDGFLPEPVFIEGTEKLGEDDCKSFSFAGTNSEQLQCLPTIPTGRFSWQELLR